MGRGSPVNILYCEGNTDGTVGGSYFSLLYLVAGLDKDKYRPLVVFHDEHAILHRYHAAGIATLIVPSYVPVVLPLLSKGNVAGSVLNPLIRSLQKTFNLASGLLGQAVRYARLIKHHRIEIVHLNNSVIRNNDWMLGAMLAGVPCITHERGINRHYSPLSRLLSRRLRAIVCISGAVRQTLERHAIGKGNLVTIYNGIDPDSVTVDESRQQLLERYGIPEGARIIGVVGNIKHWKGQETLVRALPAILRRIPNVVCLLVGAASPSDRAYQEGLIVLARELGVYANLRFTGYTDKVANHMNVMEVVVHTSVEPEPFGRVLIEAMALGKPLVAARGGAVTEIVEEHVTGLTFPPGDADALAEAVARLLEETGLAEVMGARGRARLVEHFDIRSNVRMTEALYDDVLRHP